MEWISVKNGKPKPEEEVFVLIEKHCKWTNEAHHLVTTALYEDGNVSTEDSIWCWYDMDFDYDEETDRYLIPEGWWEYRHYNPDDVYNNEITDTVTHWMTLPELPKED